MEQFGNGIPAMGHLLSEWICAFVAASWWWYTVLDISWERWCKIMLCNDAKWYFRICSIEWSDTSTKILRLDNTIWVWRSVDTREYFWTMDKRIYARINSKVYAEWNYIPVFQVSSIIAESEDTRKCQWCYLYEEDNLYWYGKFWCYF